MPIEINCTQCKKLLKIKPSRVKRQINCFCSIKCKAKYQEGLDPWNKGLKGIQKSHRKGISSNEEYSVEKYKMWHASVLKRDNYECKICNQKKTEKGMLHVHHIKSFAKYPKLRIEIDNGIVLCKKCHQFVHLRKYQIGTIESIEKIYEKISMTDIEVEDNNNFFANDILVHNSATAFRDDGKTPILNSILGKVIYKVDTQELIKQGYLVKPEILFYKNHDCTQYSSYRDDYYNNIVNNKNRNIQTTQLCEKYKGKKILILTKEIEHGRILNQKIEGSQHIHGSVEKESREKLMKLFKEDKFKVLIMTQSIGAEGLDLPNLDVIINAAANRGDVKSIQTLGRVLRIFKGKSKAIYIDFLDSGKHTYKHSCCRMKAFEDQGHTVEIR